MYTNGQIIEYEDCTFSEELTNAINWCETNGATCEELVDKRKEVSEEVEKVDETTGEKTTETVTKLMRYFQINIPEVVEPTEEELSEEVRALRDSYLQETDFTQLADAPLSDEVKAQYKEYRQYLRGIPETDGFPNIEVLTFEEWCDKK